jgi:putative ABC transport system permease protein
VLGRLAIREAVRRKGQSLLVVAGLMVGTAAITAALVAADSVADSTIANVYRSWGSVDLTVTGGTAFFPKDVADRLVAAPDVARATDGVSAGIDLAASVSDVDARQGASGAALVGFDPAAQEPFGEYVLTTGRRTLGRDLSPGDVLLSRLLADKLGARVGDRLQVTVDAARSGGAAPADLRVAGIVRTDGPGGYTLGPVVFAPLETAQRIAGTDQINVVRISAPGGIREGVAAGHRAAPVVARAVSALGTDAALTVREAKAGEIETTEEGVVIFRVMLIGMSALVVAVGAALVVNLVGMLAEERRSRLGVLRALGLRRSRLVGLSVIEGALYGLAAGVVGTAVGAAGGRLVAARLAEAITAYGGSDVDFAFFYPVKAGTLAVAFAAGTLLTLAVIVVAARRTSRMSVVAAIRDLPEPPAARARRRWVRWIRLAVFAAAGAVALVEPYYSRLAGGIVLILVLASLARTRLGRRAHATFTGLALAGWCLVMVTLSKPDPDPGAFITTLVLASLTSVFGLTILAAANLHLMENAAGRLSRASGGLSAVLRAPLAYLSRQPVRTGLTTGLFAVVIAMLALFAVTRVTGRPDYERLGSGYDVRVEATGSADVRLPDGVRAEVTRSLTLPTLVYVGRLGGEGPFGTMERTLVPLYQVDAPADPPVALAARDERFDTDRAAWDAVARDPSLVVTTLGEPGGRITLDGPAGPVTFTIAASPPAGLLRGVFGAEGALRSFRDSPRGTTMLLDVRDPARADAVARTIERSLFAQGVEADPVPELLDQATRGDTGLASVIEILMRMGLVIGILGLGIVALRVVTERRHVIGILRAIGYKRRQVIAAMLIEAGVTATIGAGVGVVAGVAMGYAFYRQDDSPHGFGIDLPGIGGVLGLIYLAVLAVTVGPAWRAARLPPAEAVRHAE